MKAPPNPPRLRDSAELHAPLSALSEETISPARLAASARAIAEAIAAPAPVVRWGVKQIGLLVAAAVIVGTGWLLLSKRARPPEPAPVVVMPAPEAPRAPAPPVEDVSPPAEIKRPVAHAQRAAPVEHVEKKSETSDLPEQVRLFHAAEEAGHAARYDDAFALLDELERRFPATTLKAEAELSRAEYLARTQRVDAAIAATEKLIASPLHAGRRAQLLRMLGDLWIRRDDCAKATPAFRAALALGLPEKEAAAAQSGIEKCTDR